MGFAGTKYEDFEGGGGINGFRTKEAGFGRVRGAKGASDALLNAAIRSRKDDGLTAVVSSVSCFLGFWTGYQRYEAREAYTG